ncbi:hypothetical protein HPA02_08210 [Bisbaumannia pacifica]|uniref:DUF3892 domain-containing protein n=1 Tax=Bisbaumannia pacifica TaxID=77098 RepID=A0A510X539_9GAMM|nr:DUF3892 domain-containing protein [Halomonas pacifica]GEK46538.1 hypothetical protein HPA02_08210 [Halomonas pacifica]
MTDRRVTATGKDDDGDITKLCGGLGSWGSVSKSQAINEIERGDYTYYVQEEPGPRATVRVVGTYPNKYLRTDADSSSNNNLDNLPHC